VLGGGTTANGLLCFGEAFASAFRHYNTPCAIDGSRSALACCRDSESDGDLSEKEKASVFRNLLELFGEWIVWASKLPPRLGLKHFGLKPKASCLVVGLTFKRAEAVLRRVQSRVGSRHLGSKASSKPSNPALGSVGDLGLATFTRVGGVPAALTVLSAPVLDLAVGSTVSSTVGLDLAVSPICSDHDVGGPVPATSARSTSGDRPFSSLSEASSRSAGAG